MAITNLSVEDASANIPNNQMKII